MWQKAALKKLGMDPEIMKQSMQQFKENPELLKNMGAMMRVYRAIAGAERATVGEVKKSRSIVTSLKPQRLGV